MPLAQREAAIRETMNRPYPPHDPIAKLIVPLLDLVPEKRICDALIARLKKARPPGPPPLLARIKAIASKR
jgi:hypothetical protein